jgi:curved DNA-binding protein CbpA
VTIIRQCFGTDCDIYRDVLKVGRHASDKQLRIAYFRRGRNVLADDQMERFSSSSTSSSPKRSGIASLKGLSTETKEKFQAVSLAYELISEPEWRALYDKYGWNAPLIDVPPRHLSMVQSNKTTTTGMDRSSRNDRSSSIVRSISPILRPSVGTAHERRSRSTGRGITWSEQVEELVFRQDPEEIRSRRVRSPPPDTSIFQKEWMNKDIDEKIDTNSFMASFLNDLDHSLDGLEASLDGLWSLNSEKAEDEIYPDEAVPVPDRVSTSSPVSVDTQVSKETQASKSLVSTLTEDDTLPSKLTESGQCSTSEYDRKASSTPEDWNRVGSASSGTLVSTIHPDDESEDLKVEQLFTALTQTTEERKKRDGPSWNSGTHSRPSDEPLHESSSPSDVKKIAVQEDDIFPRDPTLLDTRQSRKFQKDDAFDPFEDTMSTIRDTDFESPHNLRKVAKHKPRFSVIIEDVDSVASTPTNMSSKRGIYDKVPSPPRDELFSKDIAEFRDPTQAEPEQPDDLHASSLNRMHTGLSTLTGTTASVFESVYDGGSLKTTETDNASNVTPQTRNEREESEGIVIKQNMKMKPETPGKTEAPCDVDFLSHVLCYADALSTDLTKFGNEFSSKVSATKDMIMESFTFTDENMNDVMRAMEIPGVERSNTI